MEDHPIGYRRDWVQTCGHRWPTVSLLADGEELLADREGLLADTEGLLGKERDAVERTRVRLSATIRHTSAMCACAPPGVVVIVHYIEVALVVFGLNLLPAFGPPTWAVLVLFKLHWHLHPAVLVVIGVVSAGAGRYLLALATQASRKWLPKQRVESLKAVGSYLRKHRAGSAAGLAVFAVSPLPSAQLFEAAALADIPLVPITGAFMAGRVVTYTLYLGGAAAAQKSFGDTFRKALTSPYALGVELAMLVGIVLLARVDWAKRLHISPAT
jgi:hypothetical protein